LPSAATNLFNDAFQVCEAETRTDRNGTTCPSGHFPVEARLNFSR
jgi:hypothetical protein